VEFEHEGQRLVIDGGTGLQALGQSLQSPIDTTILFTHVHWDHIQGVPFFAPMFHPGSNITLAGMRSDWGSIRDALDAQMKPPQFPVGIDTFSAQLKFKDINAGDPVDIGPFKVSACLMEHPDGVFIYRVEAGGKSAVFATDIEHGARIDHRLLRFAEGADLLIHDAQYTEKEYIGETGPDRRGWGHSTWNQAVAAGRLCCANRLALFHHDPTRTDDAVAAIESHAHTLHGNAFAAREGRVVEL
jgi:phosphoribosyl 1,2-cyclic phosphodiesterase